MKRIVSVLAVIILFVGAPIGIWAWGGGPSALQPGLTVDGDVGGLVTITTPHQAIHRGHSFKVHYTTTTASDDDHRTGVYLKTPVSGEVHMVASFSVSSAGEFFICEGITIDANEGTPVAVLNRNRNSSVTSGVFDNATTPVVNKVMTWTEAQLAAGNFSCGTELEYEPLVAGSGPKPSGGVSRGTEEFILKKNTKYLFYTQNIGASANVHHVWLNWYEAD